MIFGDFFGAEIVFLEMAVVVCKIIIKFATTDVAVRATVGVALAVGRDCCYLLNVRP